MWPFYLFSLWASFTSANLEFMQQNDVRTQQVRPTHLDAIEFDGREATISTVHDALFSGQNSCRGIISAFIARIEVLNPTINAIISLNPKALELADQIDLSMTNGNVTGKLSCVPVLLKDNFDSVGMNTTAGSLSLAGVQPTTDAAVVAALKRAGAIILGKANMHELALEGLSVSSLGGQTINPYDHTRTPGGSSGGTGAAIAASLSVFGTGTDTMNSLRSPASANALFSIRPTRGLISRAGIVPVASTQDAAGPIARNVRDLAIGLTVMAGVGHDEADSDTLLIPDSSLGLDYSKDLYSERLQGMRVGIIEGFFNRTSSEETGPVNTAMDRAIEILESAGVNIVLIGNSLFNATTLLTELDVQRYEFREELEAYLQQEALRGKRPRSLPELLSGNDFLAIPSQYQHLRTCLVSSRANQTYMKAKEGISSLTTSLNSTFKTHNLDAVIYPQQKNMVVKIGAPSQSGRNGILAALTGFPSVSVPVGFSMSNTDAPIGVPIGMEILGQPWTEGKLLKLAAQWERLTPWARRIPIFANVSVHVPQYAAVPHITPKRHTIPGAYPLGHL